MRRSSLPSPAFCLALLSLFVSLGGTTYAITALPRNSVGSEQIRDRSVTERELSNNAVVSRKLATGAVTQRKIARNAITGSRIAPDSIGGDQIDEASLLAVPFAQQAETAKLATRAQVADRVEHVARADAATTADRAALADRATEAARADQADRAGIADALDRVHTAFIDADLAEGASDDFSVACPDASWFALTGGWAALDDLADLPAVSGASLGDVWLVQLSDVDSDAGGTATSGLAYAVCAKVENAT
jgi:hypothetical protein